MNTAKDLLDLSVRAVRELSAAPADGRASRSRILGELADSRRRNRRHVVTTVVTISLLLIPAASVGWIQLKRSMRAETQNLAHTEPKRTNGAIKAKPPLDEPVSSEARSASQELPNGPSAPEAALVLHHSAPVPMPIVRQPSELDLYARAHELHFHGSAPEAALRLWTQYIDRFPHGRFLPEAEFNRAVCLLRIGDSVAARRILERLARSPGDDHPKQQAFRLLTELR